MTLDIMALPHSHCSFCGAAYASDQSWPKVCAVCSQITYRNPIPVVLAMVPVDDHGLLLIRRAISPIGLALPGGYIDWGESWQTAMAREVMEETGLVITTSAFRELCILPAPGHLLIFGLAPTMHEANFPSFVPTTETSERLVVTAVPEEIVFSQHAQMICAFFNDEFFQ